MLTHACRAHRRALPLRPPYLQRYQGGEFSLFFANCEPDSAIDFDVEVSLFNVRGEWTDTLLQPSATLARLAGRSSMHRAAALAHGALLPFAYCLARVPRRACFGCVAYGCSMRSTPGPEHGQRQDLAAKSGPALIAVLQAREWTTWLWATTCCPSFTS